MILGLIGHVPVTLVGPLQPSEAVQLSAFDTLHCNSREFNWRLFQHTESVISGPIASSVIVGVIVGVIVEEQITTLQLSISMVQLVSQPTQLNQPFEGDGFVQVRVRIPPPQLALHDDQSLHHPLIGQACVLQLCVLGPEQLLLFVQDRVCVPPQQLAVHDHQSDQVGDGAFT